VFEEARRLLAAGKYQEACAKLEETRKLYAGPGVLLNLGDCYEHLGRTASAWSAFGDSATAASRAGRSDDETEANRRRTLLAPRVPHLVVQVTKELPGLVITRDGDAVPRSDWGRAIPVDPGSHDVRAEASGYLRWESRTTVPDAGQTVTVAVPELQGVAPAAQTTAEQQPTQPPGQTPPAPPNTSNATTTSTSTGSPAEAPASEGQSGSASSGRTQRILAVASGATGLAAMGAGGILGLVAKSKYDTAQQEGAGRHADSVSAVNLGNIATGATIAGGVLAAAGLVLWFTAPTSVAQVGSDGRQLLIAGQFQ
jgi:hypothetical protein